MPSGIFVKFENPMDLKPKFSRTFTFKHEVDGEAVTGVIQLDKDESEQKADDIAILNCELIDYVQVGRNTRRKDEKTNRYFIETKYVLVPTMFRFQIIDNNFVKINGVKEKPYVIKALTIALGSNRNQARPVYSYEHKSIGIAQPIHT